MDERSDVVIDMTDDLSIGELMRRAAVGAPVERSEPPPEPEPPLSSDWRRRGPPPRARARAPKLDVPPITAEDVRAMIAEERESRRAEIAAVGVRTDENILAAVLPLAEALAEVREDALKETREEIRDLKIEIAKLASINAELRQELADARTRAAGGEPLPRRLQAH
jgi:hypothetical protein